MAGKLSEKSIRNKGQGRYDDGDGLRLVVAKSGSKSRVLRFQKNGVRRDMGLGAYPIVGLADARRRAAHLRQRVAQGIDVIAERMAPKCSIPTFEAVAALAIGDMQAKSTNAKVRYQAARHLGRAYCNAILNRPVNEITTTDLAAMLRPVWLTKPEVARKLYPAVRRVFDRARVMLKADFNVIMDNPAAWADLKSQGFDPPRALSRGSHPSLAYERLPLFFGALRTRNATAAHLLEFVILTNARTDAALRADWREFDLNAGLWTIPLARLKDRKHRKDPYRVPLSPRALELLRQLESSKVGDFVFSGSKGKPLSNMAMLALLRRMNAADGGVWIDDQTGRPIVVHGFRATFRTWAEETAGFPHAVVEDAMGHVVGSVAERAYRRTDMLDARRRLMAAWAQWCEPNNDKRDEVSQAASR